MGHVLNTFFASQDFGVNVKWEGETGPGGRCSPEIISTFAVGHQINFTKIVSVKKARADLCFVWFFLLQNVVLVTDLTGAHHRSGTHFPCPSRLKLTGSDAAVCTCRTLSRAGRLHVGHHGSPSSQKSTAVV